MNEALRLDRQNHGALPARQRPWIAYMTLVALAVIAIVVASIALRQQQAQNEPRVELTPALTVSTTRPTHAVWPMILNASGAIAAWQEASIGAQVGGYRLIAVLVNVGDQVTKGQVLARFDPAMLQADNARLTASDEEANANAERMLRLQKTRAVTDRDVLQFVTQAKTADALLEFNRLQLRYTDVLASDDGVISSRTATLGAVVPIGQELFRLIRQNRLEWRGELTAAQLTHVDIGQDVELNLPGGGTARAKIREMAPALDPQSRLCIVYADIASNGQARAGMYVDGRIVIGQSDALVAPAESVTIRDGHSFILKLMDNKAISRVSLRSVVIGRRRGGELEIVSGTDDRDRLVATGGGFLNEGDLVRVTDIGDSERSVP